jgi:hypothetical protein
MYDFNGDDENLSYNDLVATATLNTALLEIAQGAIFSFAILGAQLWYNLRYE